MAKPDPQKSLPWYHAGLQFTCTACGDCCSGESGYIWVNKAEIEAMSAQCGLSVEEFEGTLLESSVRADEIGAVTLATTVSEPGRRAVPNHLAKLRKALQADTIADLGEPIAASRPR